CNSKDSESLLKGDIMKYVKNIFLVLAFALSAAAFSTSAMAASNSPPAHKPGELDIGDIVLPPPPDWCKNYPPDQMRPPEFGKICQWNK
ncbi:hypothetical protein A6P04_002724, partial [Salmonella enterica subsp. diarizonae serovar 61:i:z53]|nr:hypothetical protein [Salmonella enterica]EED8580754.1 hypothetical protein [Salmonella enterica subsp. diarizonae serovar 61:i:z53]